FGKVGFDLDLADLVAKILQAHLDLYRAVEEVVDMGADGIALLGIEGGLDDGILRVCRVAIAPPGDLRADAIELGRSFRPDLVLGDRKLDRAVAEIDARERALEAGTMQFRHGGYLDVVAGHDLLERQMKVDRHRRVTRHPPRLAATLRHKG